MSDNDQERWTCKNRTCTRDDLCWVHLRTNRVYKSRQAAYLIQARDCLRLETAWLTSLSGKEAEFVEAYPDRKKASYGMKTSKNRYIDATDPIHSSVGRYMNGCRPVDKKKGRMLDSWTPMQQELSQFDELSKGDYGNSKLVWWRSVSITTGNERGFVESVHHTNYLEEREVLVESVEMKKKHDFSLIGSIWDNKLSSSRLMFIHPNISLLLWTCCSPIGHCVEQVIRAIHV